MSEKKYIDMLDTLLTKEIKQSINACGKPIGVIVSGGIDSSLIAYYVAKHKKNVVLFTLATEHSVDLPFARILAKHLSMPLHEVVCTQKHIACFLPTVRDVLINTGVCANTMHLSLATGFYALFNTCFQKGVRSVYTGQGPDILFAGYSKYRGISDNELQQEISDDLSLLLIDIARDNAVARQWHVTLHNPYLSEKIIRFAKKLPVPLLRRGGVTKYISRMLGEKCGLPSEIVNRPKKAFQYSTGIQKQVSHQQKTLHKP